MKLHSSIVLGCPCLAPSRRPCSGAGAVSGFKLSSSRTSRSVNVVRRRRRTLDRAQRPSGSRCPEPDDRTASCHVAHPDATASMSEFMRVTATAGGVSRPRPSTYGNRARTGAVVTAPPEEVVTART